MQDPILVYDDNCPLCDWYSSLFTRYGFLPREGRRPFSKLDPSLMKLIDMNRSRHEIPLVDISSGQVAYGIDALLIILGKKMPVIGSIGRIGPVNWLLKRLYKLISYNRKVIVARKCASGNIDCAPDINYFYRLVFMFLFLVFNTLLLLPLHRFLFTPFSFYSCTTLRLEMAHFLLVAVNCGLALCLKPPRAIEFLGQVNMLAVTGIGLLLPLLLLRAFMPITQLFVLPYLGITTVIVYREYVRRMTYADVLSTEPLIAGINLACMTGFLLFVFQ